jgi:uncharacterized protein involved in type VI secretion and phage assembly
MTTSDAFRALFAPMVQSDRFYGVMVGVVTNNQDPENMHRIKVRFPWLSNDVESNWARMATPRRVLPPGSGRRGAGGL